MSDDRDEQPRDIPHPEARPDQLDPTTLERPTTAGQITPGPGLTPARAVENVSTDLPAPMPTAPDRGIVRTIHYNLSYIVHNAGAGPRGAIVLLHDLPGGAYVWAPLLDRLAGTGRAVYAFDLLGYGDSDHPWPSDTSIWGHADGLEYALAALRLTDIVLVGFGLGGAVAQVLASRLYYDRIARLVLINSYGYLHAYAPDWPLPEMTKRQDPEAPKHTKTDQALADLRKTVPLGSANNKLPAAALDAYVQMWNSEIGKELIFQHVRLMLPSYTNSVSSYLRTLEFPTLLIWGEADTVTPLDPLGRRMAREIPDNRLEVVPNAGHLILDDAPDAVARFVADFAGAPATAAGGGGFVVAR
ncbi:MAG TPA: alpha/beta hydrolase [Ktedonobacterales bacterium]|jgi:pimeloyl-ACP methyl ester carboxylesterase|nr:alpha/beta hydrolase [Ktedonobacterales bacterium]